MDNEIIEQQARMYGPPPTENNEQTSFSNNNEPIEKVHGWFTFFLFVIAIGSIFGLIMVCVNMSIDDYYGSQLLAFLEIQQQVFYVALAAYTIYCVLKGKPNAVFWCKFIAVFLFITNLVLLVGGEFDDTSLNSLQRVASSFIWSIIWILYFTFSKQVNRLFPKEERKLYSYDKWLAFLFYLPVLLMIVGFIYIGINGSVVKIDRDSLGPNEYTDGVIAFTAPDGYMVESEDIDDMTHFSVTRADSLVIMNIVGGTDTDDSEENFNNCWELANDHSFDDWDKEFITDRQ